MLYSGWRIGISIHAPLTGSDGRVPSSGHAQLNFNPRSPYGERHVRYKTLADRAIFQSTLPLRGATPLL